MSNVLKHKRYVGTVQYSSEDSTFYGQIHGIRDLVNYEGTSASELEQAFKEAVEEYLQTCKDMGKEPDKPYNGSFNVRVSGELHKEASIVAVSNNMTLNELVKSALNYAVGHVNEVVKKGTRQHAP
jgi:predicted HicB family RNase H-like nuclease